MKTILTTIRGSVLVLLLSCNTARADDTLVPAASNSTRQGMQQAIFAEFPSALPLVLRARILKEADDHGYRPAKFRGALVYCRPRVPLGTRFAQTECVNEEQMYDALKREARLKDSMAQPRGQGSDR